MTRNLIAVMHRNVGTKNPGNFCSLFVVVAFVVPAILASQAEASGIKQITITGVFNDSLAGTALDAGDPFTFVGVMDTFVPDSSGNSQLGNYPGALVSGDFVIDGGALTVHMSQGVTEVHDNLGQDAFILSDPSLNLEDVIGFNGNNVNQIAIQFTDPSSEILSNKELPPAVQISDTSVLPVFPQQETLMLVNGNQVIAGTINTVQLCDLNDSCALDACTPELCGAPVPTVSEWGLITLSLLILSIGTIIYGHRTFAS